ncbi:hypothetical protein [Pseudobacillus wudalianchiensis]|uniref:Uncharacterized protein n=1 Tax=Pseudobacillus wudalianchiensis TaxID=1743143 RepID=A0A1B9B8I2_9BACI|nr:hypothetical protein [Bacillus wudalianchiensis]OCA92391.1 hypothetical protein A8F95_01355 [Bacillus wudalianchiensis]
MNLMHNNKGNALLLVLLITVIFTALGLSIIASTLGGTKRTEIRKEEIAKAFASIKVIDQITADLSAELQSSPKYEIAKLTTGSVSAQIDEILTTLKMRYEDPIKGIEKIDFKDVTTAKGYLTPAEFNNTLTRVYEIYVTAKTGEEKGNIRRTATKRLIISPLPSFLKYAVGAEDGKLILNGSPNINGNIFANQLLISKNAKYYSGAYDPEKGPDKKMATPYPSIMKDLYASEFNSRHLQEILDLLRSRDEEGKTYFYKDKVPALKNDSQYQEIDFEGAFEEEQRKALGKVAVPNKDSLSTAVPSLQNDIAKGIEVAKSLPGPIPEKTIVFNDQDVLGEAGKHVGDLIITNTNKKIIADDLYVHGDLLIVANQSMTFNNIYATGTVKIISYNGNLSIAGNIASQGAITLMNNKGTVETKKAIATEQTLTITNKDTMFISNEGTPKKQNLFAAEKINITNETDGKLVLTNDLVAGKLEERENKEDTIVLTLNGQAKIKGNILSLGNENNNNITLLIYDNLDEKLETSFKGNVYAKGKLILRGNTEGTAKENDELKVDGVMYASGEAMVSNLNIVGLEDEDTMNNQIKQLILLSGEAGLVITRINEFNNYEELEETPNTNYVPADHVDDSKLNIKPIKGFFYTEGEAELYGVGSLFYVDGGLFAKSQLEINAIRGKTEKDSDGKPEEVSVKDQEGFYSRFIVNYNEDVLLQNFETLPKVKYLSIYPDDLTVE